jgi:ribonuclease P protein subunit RPR2
MAKNALKNIAKAKVKKESKNVQSHIRARLDYLHKAAVYLQTAQQNTAHQVSDEKTATSTCAQDDLHMTSHDSNSMEGTSGARKTKEPMSNLSRVCVSHLRGVALKTQIRLPVALKRSVCKRCDTLLAPGLNCSHEIENASRGGQKPWADVLVVRCFECGTIKRFPQAEKRGKKLAQRREEAALPCEVTTVNADVVEGA